MPGVFQVLPNRGREYVIQYIRRGVLQFMCLYLPNFIPELGQPGTGCDLLGAVCHLLLRCIVILLCFIIIIAPLLRSATLSSPLLLVIDHDMIDLLNLFFFPREVTALPCAYPTPKPTANARFSW